MASPIVAIVMMLAITFAIVSILIKYYPEFSDNFSEIIGGIGKGKTKHQTTTTTTASITTTQLTSTSTTTSSITATTTTIITQLSYTQHEKGLMFSKDVILLELPSPSFSEVKKGISLLWEPKCVQLGAQHSGVQFRSGSLLLIHMASGLLPSLALKILVLIL